MNPRIIFTAFFLLNFANYLDRNVTSGILPFLKSDFHTSDAVLGGLGSAFMITYALTAIPFGIWSDRWRPHKVAAVGAVVWSVATLCSGLAGSIVALFMFRALVGVGEAAFVSTGSTILSHVYPKQKRSRILGWFNLGMPIGGAAGVILGGVFGTRFGWQSAFLIVGIPGLILAYFTWRLKVPYSTETSIAAVNDDWDAGKIQAGHGKPGFRVHDVKQLFLNVPYMFTCLGYAGISFSFGAIVLFAPTFFHRVFGYSVESAGTIAGLVQVVAGVLGGPIGGVIADAWYKRNPRGRAYSLVIAMLCSAVSLTMGLYLHSIIAFSLSAFFMLWHVGVASAMIFDSTEKRIWNTGQAVALLIMHLLGDIPSPAIVGYISDKTDMFTSFTLLPIPMVIAAVCFFIAGRANTNAGR